MHYSDNWFDKLFPDIKFKDFLVFFIASTILIILADIIRPVPWIILLPLAIISFIVLIIVHIKTEHEIERFFSTKVVHPEALKYGVKYSPYSKFNKIEPLPEVVEISRKYKRKYILISTLILILFVIIKACDGA